MVRKSDGKTDLYTIFVCKLISLPEDLRLQESEIADGKWFDLDHLNDYEDILNYTRVIIENWRKDKLLTRDTSFDEMAKDRMGVRKYEQYWV